MMRVYHKNISLGRDFLTAHFTTDNRAVFESIDKYFGFVPDRGRSAGAAVNYFIYSRRGQTSKGVRRALASVNSDPRAKIIEGRIYNNSNGFKEQMFEFMIIEPLRFILAHQGIFFIHASVVSKRGECILFSGEKDSGKSTMALTLFLTKKYKFLTDDKCFLRFQGKKPELFFLPTSAGINANILKKYPGLGKSLIKSFSYGGKRRLCMNTLYSEPEDDLTCKAVVFPVYKEGAEAGIKELSGDAAFKRLANANMAFYPKEEEKYNNIFARNFFALYGFIDSTRCFEIIYNDNKLGEACCLIDKLVTG